MELITSGGSPNRPGNPFRYIKGEVGEPPYEIIYFPLSKENPECGINYLVGVSQQTW